MRGNKVTFLVSISCININNAATFVRLVCLEIEFQNIVLVQIQVCNFQITGRVSEVYYIENNPFDQYNDFPPRIVNSFVNYAPEKANLE